MAFGKWCVVLACCLIFPGMVQAQEIELELKMPGSLFGPGSPFSLDLLVNNPSPALNDAQLFVALTIGTGDFWFFPTWNHYPPDIDWDTVDVPASVSDNWEILPMFSWPSGAGALEGAMFFAAILHNGVLMSNLANVTFGWTDVPIGWVYFNTGIFTMGSPTDEPCRDAGETQHQVTLTQGFFMMNTEVTRLMWEDLKAVQPMLPADPSLLQFSPTVDHPVQYLTWQEAVLFANLLSLKDGFAQCYYKDSRFATPIDVSNYTSETLYCNFNASGYRLPTESEWEYACRAGTTSAFSCNEPNYNTGNCDSCTSETHPTLEQYCVYCANYPESTAVVGSKLPNPAGLYDMHGNVFEWCWDWYGDYPSGSVTDPTGASFGALRVARGGNWNVFPRYCRSAFREIGYPYGRYYQVGFRLVRTIP